jgi:hypothetical protein
VSTTRKESPNRISVESESRFLLVAACGVYFFSAILGCGAYKRIAPVSPTFLEGVDTASTVENLPFDHAWVQPNFDARKYSKLFIKPVRTDLVSDESRTHSFSAFLATKEGYDEAVGQIAEYFRAEIIGAIGEYPGNRITIVDKPGPGVITAEIALTEVEFSHPVARAASLAAPIPGTGAAISAVTDTHAAFALRVTDPSGKLVATVADRKYPPTRIIDLNKLTVSSSAREVCALWADTMAEAFNKGRFAPTSAKGRFSLWFW